MWHDTVKLRAFSVTRAFVKRNKQIIILPPNCKKTQTSLFPWLCCAGLVNWWTCAEHLHTVKNCYCWSLRVLLILQCVLCFTYLIIWSVRYSGYLAIWSVSCSGYLAIWSVSCYGYLAIWSVSCSGYLTVWSVLLSIHRILHWHARIVCFIRFVCLARLTRLPSQCFACVCLVCSVRLVCLAGLVRLS